MNKRKALLTFLLATSLAMFADNTSQIVKEVTTPVTLDGDVDYHITSATPFTTTGSVNITNTDHAVVIFDNLQPSKVGSYLNHVTINGSAAVDGKNCQLRIYNGGSMVLPYSGAQPLTVFTAENFGGTSSSNYNVNTIYQLPTAFNNKIRSFKLKRGFMVCFATQSNGQGYSRVFIADKADKEINLADVSKPLNGRISFLRISKWNDVQKKGWAGFWSNDVQEKFNTGWAYNWDANIHSDWVDREYVTQHHHEGWPGIADVGNNTGSANILGNNEPDNKADDKEQDIDVKNVLANWPQMMATGRRLGSPAVSSNYSWLYEFIDSIDARGWRCDFIAVHAYWYKDQPGWKSQLESISKRCGGRPIWITEMNYGANWTGWPGSNTSASDANYAIEKQHMAPVLDYLNDSSYIERYAFYNNVQECRYAIAGNELTPIGQYYADLTPKMAYNSKHEFVPKNPKVYAPSNLTCTFMPATSTCVLSWKNHSGEFLDEMYVERKKGINGEWERQGDIVILEDTAKNYSFKQTIEEAGAYYYRIVGQTYLGRTLYSREMPNVVNGSEGTADIQWGTMSANNDDDIYNFYEHSFTEKPAVINGGTTSTNWATNSVETVNLVTTNYFRSKFFPWNALDTDANDFTKGNEQASFLVAKPGNGTIGTLHYEAGLLKKTSDAGNVSNLTVGSDTVEYKFNQSFDEVPVVFVTPISTLKYPVKARVWDITKEGFKVVLTRQVGASKYANTIVKQAVSYLAIEKGTATAFGKKFMVGANDYTFTSAGSTYPFEFGSELKNPKMVFQYQTFNRNLLTLVRLGNDGLTATGCKFKVVADTTDPNKTINPTKPVVETIGWIAIGDDDSETGIQTVATGETSNLSVEVSDGVLRVSDANAAAVSVYAVSGAKVASAQMVAGEATINLDVLPVGVLVVKTNSGKSAKIVVRR